MGSVKVAKEWLSYANVDLVGAKALAEMGEKFFPLATFHAQQCAEKAIKGYLVYQSVRVPKTHEMADLLAIVELKDPAFAKQISSAAGLTDYAVAYRYPDAQKVPLKLSIVTSVIEIAHSTLENCKNKIH